MAETSSDHVILTAVASYCKFGDLVSILLVSVIINKYEWAALCEKVALQGVS